MDRNKSLPHCQNTQQHLSDLLLADWNWLHPIEITFNSLCPAEFCELDGANTWKNKNMSLPRKLIFSKSCHNSIGSLPNFPKHMFQLWEILEPQYFSTLLLDPHWIYFWKHCIYYKKDTRFGGQSFGWQLWFCARLFKSIVSTGWAISAMMNIDRANVITRTLVSRIAGGIK